MIHAGPLHPVRHLRRRLPVELHRHRRGHRPARARQDVHRLLALLGLLPAGRTPLRGAVAAFDPRRRGEDAEVQPRPRSRVPTPRTRTGRSPEARPADGLGAVVDAYAVRAAARARRRPGRRRGQRAADRRCWPAGEIDGAAGVRSRATTPTSSGRASPPRHDGRGDLEPRPAASTTRPWRWPSWTCPATRCRPSRASPWSGPRARCRGSGPCRRGAGRRGAHRIDAVVLTIALMCTKNFDYEA